MHPNPPGARVTPRLACVQSAGQASMVCTSLEALLTLARKVHAAADDDDPQRLEQAALHLFDALATHVRDEDVTMGALSPALVRILGRGQERLLSLAAELAAEAAAGCTSTSELCRTRTEELLALLVLQARDEHVALYDPAA